MQLMFLTCCLLGDTALVSFASDTFLLAHGSPILESHILKAISNQQLEHPAI